MRDGDTTMVGTAAHDDAKLADAEYANRAQQAKREKTWDESGIEEKVERLRRHEQETRRWLQALQEQMQHVPEHQHGQHGEILVRQHGGYGMVAGGQAQRRFDPLE